ncbi:MAG: hypothetical protein K5896_09400, partial [Prevotella sp.]|nr:hypothetical protein [Prevotella sp.]
EAIEGQNCIINAVGTTSINNALSTGQYMTLSFQSQLTGDDGFDLTVKLVKIMELADNADNTNAINGWQNGMANVTISGRTLYKDGDWNTLCLPFAVSDFTDTPLAGADVRALESSSFADGTLTLNFSQDPLTAIEAGKPYLVKWDYDLEISSQEDWNNLAANVRNGNSYEGKVVRLTADIDVTAPVGTSDNMFKGTFDGEGHTINITLAGSGQFCAPFAYVSGATIANLNVTGTVTLSATKAYHASGLVGQANGVTVRNCHVSASILFPDGTGTVHSGGIIGHAKSSPFTMTDCLFDGTFGYVSGGSGTMTNVGGLVGWDDASTPNITNCLNAGTFVNPGVISRIARVNGRGTITNCYSTIEATSSGNQNDDRGTYTTATGSELASLLGSNWQVSNGQAVPMMNASSDIISPVFADVTISGTTVNTETDAVDFVGIFSPAVIYAADNSNYFVGAGNKLYYPTDANYTLNACRAYFHLKTPAASRMVMNFGEDRTTGINETSREPATATWYTLDGRKLSEKPVRKGMYIYNGRKVVIK